MKNYSLMIALMLGILLSALTPKTNLATVYAQAPVCYNATGGVIPCPPTEDASKKPTPTPLPIVARHGTTPRLIVSD